MKKTTHCKGCRQLQTAEINAGAWSCRGCGWVTEMTKMEKRAAIKASVSGALAQAMDCRKAFSWTRSQEVQVGIYVKHTQATWVASTRHLRPATC